MSTTRQAIRREAADRLACVLWGTATDGSTTYLADTEKLQSNSMTPDRYTGSWLNPLTNALNLGKYRRIASYIRDSGRVNLDHGLPAPVVAGDEYEIYDLLSPDDWNKCVNRALRRLPCWRDLRISPVSDQLRYELTQYIPQVETEDDVVRVSVRDGGPATSRDRVLHQASWHVEQTDSGIYLYLNNPVDPVVATTITPPATMPPETPATGGRLLVLRVLATYPELATDAATTSCNLDWATAATVVEAYDIYGKALETGLAGANAMDRAQAAAWETDCAERFGPSYSQPISPPWY